MVPPATLKVISSQSTRRILIEQANIWILAKRPPTSRQFTLHEQLRRQLLNFPLLGVRVEGMLDYLAAMVNHIDPANIGVVTKMPVRDGRKSALRWSVGEVEVS